ncbi:MAG: class I SAM-dependent methyltransferase [Rhodocyclaceae bacterium]|nr:class I SAM-dependent methyltransferase [Rhodocyclaceae bacterium]
MPTLKALGAQVLGWLVVAGLLVSGDLPDQAPLGLALIQGGFAAATGLALKSDRWWIPIHLSFSPLLVLAGSLRLDPGWFLGAFLLLALIYWSSFRTQVPLYLSNRITAEALLALLPPDQSRTVLDLGCGTGSLLARLARERPDSRFEGVETAPLPWLAAFLTTRTLANCRVMRKDFWHHSLEDYDLVYAFLSPVPMSRLWSKACAEMRPGSLLVSNSFPISEVTPESILAVPDKRQTRLYLYRIPGGHGGEAAR